MKITIPPEEQMWTVAEAIANASEITPTGKTVLIDQGKISEKVSPIELKQILEKLVDDKKIIEILHRPSDLRLSEDNGCYGVKIIDQKGFRDFLNFAHSRHFGDVKRLAGDNFFAICDVAMDIYMGLQLSTDETVKISVVPSIIRFSSLCPAKSVHLLDRYGDFRMNALIYMEEREHILGYKIIDDMYASRWDKEITVWVDRFSFEKFYKKLIDTYEVRVVQPAKKQKAEHPKEKEKNPETNEQKPPVMPYQIEITKMPPLDIRNVDERAIVKNAKRITLPSFPRTEWTKVSIRFIDDRNILLSDNKDTKPCTFEGLGCSDTRNDKPDDTWKFLLKVANGNGSTGPIRKDEREKQKKQKQKLTDILRKIFKNDGDPFETESGGVYKAKFIIEYPTDNTTTQIEHKYSDLEEIRNEMSSSRNDSTDSEFSQ